MTLKTPQVTLKNALDSLLNNRWRGMRTQMALYSTGLEVVNYHGPARTKPLARADHDLFLSKLTNQGLASSTINRYVAVANVIVQEFEDLTGKTGAKMRYLKEPQGRIRVITVEELYRLQDETVGEPVAIALWQFLHETGLRLGEALDLRLIDVAVDRVVVRRSKNGQPRTVPSHSRWYDWARALATAGVNERHRLFAISPSRVRRAWNGARRRMGLGHDREFVPHALRHTCATNLVKAGVSLALVQKWMGHSNIKTTLRYAHVDTQDLLAAAKKVGTIS